jgi:HD superfamily phosphohydrolase
MRRVKGGYGPEVVRDPVYGYITISDDERKVIDLPIFQRLRRIHQLSFTELVYPGATHTRFSHSLGAMELAKRAARYLRDQGIISDDDERALIWAALLHDIGHLPFSHAFEPAYAHFVEGIDDIKEVHKAHVRIGQKILEDKNWGIAEVIGDDNMVKRVCNLIAGDEKERMLKDIITGLFSVDRLDYLKRDAHHCGTFEYASVDAERILFSLRMYSKLNTLVYDERGLYALEGALLSHFNMYRAVYYHRAVRAAYLLFHDILWKAFENNIFTKNDDIWRRPQSFIEFDECECLRRLKESREKSLSEELDLLLKRKLPKMVKTVELPAQGKILSIFEKGIKEKAEKEAVLLDKMKKKYDLELLFIDAPPLIPYPREIGPRPLVLTRAKKEPI